MLDLQVMARMVEDKIKDNHYDAKEVVFTRNTITIKTHDDKVIRGIKQWGKLDGEPKNIGDINWVIGLVHDAIWEKESVTASEYYNLIEDAYNNEQKDCCTFEEAKQYKSFHYDFKTRLYRHLLKYDNSHTSFANAVMTIFNRRLYIWTEE